MKNVRENLILIIDHNIEAAALLKQVIEGNNPRINCLSFRYAHEAWYAIANELRHLPGYIFLDANDNQFYPNDYLQAHRSIKGSGRSKIVLMSDVLPQVVANTFVANGAAFAFQKPISRSETQSMVAHVFGENQ